MNSTLTIEPNHEKNNNNKIKSLTKMLKIQHLTPPLPPNTLGLKITKSSSRKPTHGRLSKNNKSLPPFFPFKKLVLISLNFQQQFFSIFNNSYTISLKVAPLLIEDFPRYQECGGRQCDLEDLNMINKLPSLYRLY